MGVLLIFLLENQLLLDIGDQYPAGFEVSPELTLPARLTKGARATATDDEAETDPVFWAKVSSIQFE